MEVFIYRGLSSVPSIDFNCLRTLAIIKVCNAPVKVNAIATNPFHSPNGCLPYLRAADGTFIAGYTAIVRHLKEEGHWQGALDAKLEGLSDAYLALLSNQLYAALQYQLWGEPQHGENTRQMYASRTPFPFSFWHPSRYIKRTDTLMQTLYNFALDDKLIDHDTGPMLLRARQCLNHLEAKFTSSSATTLNVLGAPCELDATLYAYLACIQNVLPHNDILRTHQKQCEKLTQFVHRFQKAHFGDVSAMCRVDRAEEQRLLGTATTQDLDEGRDNRWQSQLLAGFIACGAMGLFAYKQGIFRSSSEKYELQYSGDDDDDDEPDDD